MFKIIKAFFLTGIFFLLFFVAELTLAISRPLFWTKISIFGRSYAFYLGLAIWSLFSIISVLSTYKILGKFKKLSLFIPLFFISITSIAMLARLPIAVEMYTSLFTQLCIFFLVEWLVFRWLEKKEALKAQKRL